MAGRPSNRDERTQQVMAALVKTVARLGIDGASLSAIANEAGMTRPLVRHHLGNREDMLAALENYVLHRFDRDTEMMLASLPEENAAEALVDFLFSESAGVSGDLVMAFAALTARAGDDHDLRKACRQSVDDFEAAISKILCSQFSNAPEERAKEAAHGIAALYFNTVSLAPLDMSQSWHRRAKAVARSLINSL